MNYNGQEQSRHCIVVLVEDVASAKEHLQKGIITKVIKAIYLRSGHVIAEEEDPFWLKFVYHTPKLYSHTLPVMYNGGNEAETIEQAVPVFRPGHQITTKDGVHGTVGLFLCANVGGQHKHYGVTCGHVFFHEEVCNRSESDARCMLSEFRGLSKDITVYKTRGIEAALCMLSSDPEPAKIIKLLQKTKVYQIEKYDRNTKTTPVKPNIGLFQGIVHGLLISGDEGGVSCDRCGNKRFHDVDDFFVDIGLISLDQNDFQCGMEDINKGSWEIWQPGTEIELDMTSDVYTYNVRKGPLHTENKSAQVRSACKRLAKLEFFGSVTTESPDHKTLINSPPHLCLRPNDFHNDRLFADFGDSGSLLYQQLPQNKNLILGILSRMKSCHEQCPGCTSLVTEDGCQAHAACGEGQADVSCASNPEQCRNPTKAYGFLLQPALDAVMCRHFISISGKAVPVEFLGHTVAANYLKIDGFECMYSPCLTKTTNICQLQRRCICQHPLL